MDELPKDDVVIAPAPEAAAKPAPAEVSLHDFAMVERLPHWQRHLLARGTAQSTVGGWRAELARLLKERI